MEDNVVDFALIAWREDGRWQVESLTPRACESLDAVITALRAQPGEGGSIALISVAEEFFLIVRVLGAQVRVLLSDELAALDWPLAAQALDLLEMDPPDEDEDDDEESVPAGDIGVLADFGVSGDELEMLCGDMELFPDEALATVASRLGFGDAYEAATSSLN